MKTISALFFMIALNISACGKGSTPVTNTFSTSQSALVGTWRLDCTADDGARSNDKSKLMSHDELLQINSADGFHLVVNEYASADCASVNSYSKSELTGSVSVGTTTFKPILTQVLITPLDADAADDFNSTQACARADWILSQSSDCTHTASFDEKQEFTYAVTANDLTVKTCKHPKPKHVNCTSSHYTRVN